MDGQKKAKKAIIAHDIEAFIARPVSGASEIVQCQYMYEIAKAHGYEGTRKAFGLLLAEHFADADGVSKGRSSKGRYYCGIRLISDLQQSSIRAPAPAVFSSATSQQTSHPASARVPSPAQAASLSFAKKKGKIQAYIRKMAAAAHQLAGCVAPLCGRAGMAIAWRAPLEASERRGGWGRDARVQIVSQKKKKKVHRQRAVTFHALFSYFPGPGAGASVCSGRHLPGRGRLGSTDLRHPSSKMCSQH